MILQPHMFVYFSNWERLVNYSLGRLWIKYQLHSKILGKDRITGHILPYFLCYHAHLTCVGIHICHHSQFPAIFFNIHETTCILQTLLFAKKKTDKNAYSGKNKSGKPICNNGKGTGDLIASSHKPSFNLTDLYFSFGRNCWSTT